MIIPAFNAAGSIGETLDSVLAQSFADFDVTVVDDGSSDDTAAVVERRAAVDPRIALVRRENAGVAAARNLAIERSRGAYVAPLDADDLWDAEKLALQVAALEAASSAVAFCYCWWRNVDSGGRALYPGPRWRVEGHAFERLLAVNFVGSASIPLIRREALSRVGGYSERLRRENGQGCEDWDLYLRLAERHEVRVVPRVLVSYRSHGASMSSNLESMRRSHELVLADVRRRRPDVAESTFARSRSNLSLHLAGVQFKRNDLVGTWRWTLEAFRLHAPTAISFLAASAPTILGGFLRRRLAG